MSSTRAFSVTVRAQDGSPVANADVDVNLVFGLTDSNGRVRIDGVSVDWHQVQLSVYAEGYALYSKSINLDKDHIPGQPFGDVEWDDVYLGVQDMSLRVENGRFMVGDMPFTVKGSTDFRLPERVLAGVDISSILNDRMDAGANWLRMLSMKANNTGYELNPRSDGYWAAVEQTFQITNEPGFFVEWCVFADTKRMMADTGEQHAHYNRTLELAAKYPHVLIELLNEDKHPTQSIDAQSFPRPMFNLASHGSGLSDAFPVRPLWDYGSYHARRAPANNLGKIISNYGHLTAFEHWPPECLVPEETLKPEQYGYAPQVAYALGQQARTGTGGTFHHSAWLDERFFNDGERACAVAFYSALD